MSKNKKDTVAALEERACGFSPERTESLESGGAQESVSKWHLQSSLNCTEQMGKRRESWKGAGCYPRSCICRIITMLTLMEHFQCVRHLGVLLLFCHCPQFTSEELSTGRLSNLVEATLLGGGGAGSEPQAAWLSKQQNETKNELFFIEYPQCTLQNTSSSFIFTPPGEGGTITFPTSQMKEPRPREMM